MDPTEQEELDAKLTAAHEMGHATAHREDVVAMEHELLKRGFSPRTKTTQTMTGSQSEQWWVKGSSLDWPSVTLLISLLIFVVVMLKLP